MPDQGKCKREGFTLLEVTMVVAILVTVGTMALPATISRLTEARFQHAAAELGTTLRMVRMQVTALACVAEVEVHPAAGTIDIAIDRDLDGYYDLDERKSIPWVDAAKYECTANGAYSYRTDGSITSTGGVWMVRLYRASIDREAYLYVLPNGSILESGTAVTL